MQEKTDRVHRVHHLDKIMASFGTSSVVVRVPSRNVNNHIVIDDKMKKNNIPVLAFSISMYVLVGPFKVTPNIQSHPSK